MTDATSATPATPAGFRFPGRWVRGVALDLGPRLIATGTLLRVPFFFAPQRLAAYEAHPTLVTAAWGADSTGRVVPRFGIIAPANLLGRRSPVQAAWGRSAAAPPAGSSPWPC